MGKERERGKDLPDQCQNASYAPGVPVAVRLVANLKKVKECHTP